MATARRTSSTQVPPTEMPSIRAEERFKARQPGMSIFSTENFMRICQEQKEAKDVNNNIPLNKIIEIEKPGENFFLQYKNISMSRGNIHNAAKSQEQIREEKAVQLFFRKQIAQMTQEYMRKMSK